MIQKKGPGVGFYGKVRIPTIGHAAAIDTAKEIAKRTGGKLHIGLSGTSHPLSAKDKREHAKRVFGHEVMPEGEATKNIVSFLSHMSKHHDELHLVAGSDRASEYKNLLQKYNNKPDRKGNVPFAFKKWQVHEVKGKREEINKDPRTMNNDELRRSVSASKLEQLAKEGKYEQFKAYHPNINERHVKHIYDQIRRSLHEEMEVPNIGLTLSRDLMPQMDIPRFISFLKEKGIGVSKKDVVCSDMKSSQSEFDDDKIMSMMNTDNQKPIIVSNDNHVLDGHHRWLADHNSGKKTIKAWVVDLPIFKLLQISKEFNSLNEEVTHKELAPMLDSFVVFASDKLGILEPPKINLPPYFEKSDQPSFGSYRPSTKEISLQTKNRHPLDILRTLAHELVHHKQNEDGRIQDVAKEGSTGSPIEDEANSVAGKIMRWFGKANPDMFKMKHMIEQATFVVGGPCSGKDLFIRKFKEKSNIKEIDIHKLYKTDLLNEDSKLLITGSAENIKEIIEANNLLKFNGYETRMVFIDISNETSKMRNESRKDRGQKVLNESIRVAKFNSTEKNKDILKEMFGDDMLIIDNSEKVTINETKKEENMDSIFESYIAENKPRDREFGTTSLRRIYKNETPGEGKRQRKQKIVKKKIKEKLDSPLSAGGIPPDGIGPEYSIAKSPSLVFGFANINESVYKWGMNPKVIERYMKKYDNLAERKLFEDMIKFSNIDESETIKVGKKSLAKIKESFDKGIGEIGSIPKQGKDMDSQLEDCGNKKKIRRIARKHK